MAATKGGSEECILGWLKVKLLLTIELVDDYLRSFCSAKESNCDLG